MKNKNPRRSSNIGKLAISAAGEKKNSCNININYYKNNNIYNTKNNIFNINTFDYSKNNNINNTNNMIFNSKNI